jgi:hypothetical protein
MRIYKINIEHTTHGLNWSSVKVAAKTAEQAIRAAKKNFNRGERVESVELIASVD